MDRWQVSSIPGADFILKIITPSCWTIEKTTHSGISFGSHLQNAECEPQIFWSSVRTVPIEKLKRYSTFRRKKSIVISSAQWLPRHYSASSIGMLLSAGWIFRQVCGNHRFNTCRWSMCLRYDIWRRLNSTGSHWPLKNLSSESHFEHKAFTTVSNKFFFDALTIQRQQSTLVAILKNLPVNTDRLHGS
jgi:hypothetical protein